jgi:hypothetical protein
MMKISSFKIRHPERSEANGLIFCQCARPSAVEGPGHSCPLTYATKPIFPETSRSAASWHRHLPRIPRVSSLQPRSFDFGSASRSAHKYFLFASAQDDEIFPLVPKLYLGTPLVSAKFHFAPFSPAEVTAWRSAMELPQQVRSQIEFGNEGKAELILRQAQDDGRGNR